MGRSHREALLEQNRCGACAERVPFRTLVDGGACPHCDLPVRHALEGSAESVVERICDGWRRWRLAAYGGLACVTLFTSVLPLVAPVMFAVTMIVVQLLLIRRPIRLLGPYRRIATRLTLKLLLAALTMLNLVISVAVFPLFGVAQVVPVVVSVLFGWIYLEGALALLRNRMRREASSARLDAWEWALPAAIIGALALAAATLVLAVGGLAYVLLEAEVPGIGTLVDFLMRREGA